MSDSWAYDWCKRIHGELQPSLDALEAEFPQFTFEASLLWRDPVDGHFRYGGPDFGSKGCPDQTVLVRVKVWHGINTETYNVLPFHTQEKMCSIDAPTLRAVLLTHLDPLEALART